MTDHANELRRHARKIPHPQGETPGVMLRAADEIECLRAKIEAMERQEPIGTVHAMPGASAFTMACFDVQDIPVGAHLYALPGAQPAPSINPAALSPVISWLRNGCDPIKAADELEMLAASPEAK